METAVKYTTEMQITQAKALLKHIQDQGRLVPANDLEAVRQHKKTVMIQENNIRILEVINTLNS